MTRTRPPTRRSTGNRWWRLFEQAEARKNWPGRSKPRPRWAAIGSNRLIWTRAVGTTDSLRPSARSLSAYDGDYGKRLRLERESLERAAAWFASRRSTGAARETGSIPPESSSS